MPAPSPTPPPASPPALRGLSIRAAVLTAIVVGVVLPALLAVMIDHRLQRQTQQPIAERNQTAVLTLATAALTEPAWTLSEPALQEAMQRILDEPSVCRIELLDLQPMSTPLVMDAGQCATTAALTVREATVLHDALPIARLRLSFDDSALDAQLAARRQLTAWVVVAQVLFGVAVLTGVLSARLLRPIDRLKRQARALAAGELDHRSEWPRDDELGQLGRDLDEAGGQLRGLIGELETKNEELRRLALFDPLTGLPNRALLIELFGRAAAAARREGHPMALIFVDLDDFKGVNDAHGHSAGDELLIGVGERMRQSLRESDLVCRLSGDEFLVLLPRTDGIDSVATMAERMLKAIQAPMPLAGAAEPARVGGSVGIAMFPDDGEDFVELARAADVAMYRSKELGRGRISFYHADMDVTLRARLALDRELADALDAGQLRLHFQPVVDARDGRTLGCEALVRWQHPQRGLLGPDQFIPAAERTGLIAALGRWVLDNACEQLARWQAVGQPTLQMAVNVSALQLAEPAFVDQVAAALRRHGLARGALVLELTESTLLAEGDGAQHAMAALREAGVLLAIDDFGTGFSSLAAMKLVRPDRLKIDRSFVRDLPGKAADAALVDAIFAMARALDIVVVAEGVETEVQRDWLQARGGHLQQGWLWARALPADAFEARLAAEAAAQPSA